MGGLLWLLFGWYRGQARAGSEPSVHLRIGCICVSAIAHVWDTLRQTQKRSRRKESQTDFQRRARAGGRVPTRRANLAYNASKSPQGSSSSTD